MSALMDPEQLLQRLREAEERANRAEAERDQEREKTRPTTLDGYLEACHNLVYARLTVETDPSKTTTGSIRAYHKLVPERLKQWTSFFDEQGEMLTIIYSFFPVEERLFDNRAYLATLGNKVSAAPIADEKMLENFLHNCVEEQVRCIIHELSKSEEFQRQLNIGSGIKFENHLKAISDTAFEVVERERRQPLPPVQQESPEPESQRPRTPDLIRDPAKLNADQICIYRYEEAGLEKRSVVAIAEYKPPHKLTLPQLRKGLHDMHIFQDVVCNNKIPTEAEAKFTHYAEELTAAAITQTYHYMIKGGLAYSLLTTGEAIVFLKIDWRSPEFLYYHLAEPGPEVEAHGQFRSCTAISQYLAFHLLALSDHAHISQDRRQEVIGGLRQWKVDFRRTASTISKDQQEASPTSPAFTPTTYSNVDRSVKHRRRKPKKNTEPGGTLPVRRRRDDEPDDGGGSNRPPSPSPQQPRQNQGTRRSQRVAERTVRESSQGESKNESKDSNQGVQYCTQRCLLGLVRGYILDTNCPNFAVHRARNRKAKGSKFHPITHVDFLKLLSRQLKRTLDSGITSLDITGARGALFKISLLAYGYTFIGKGTVKAFISDLKHEALVYKQLEGVQGTRVPVFLGAIDLSALGRTYYYDFRVYVVHLSFMSWGGVGLRDIHATDLDEASLTEMAIQSMKAIHQEGVVHMDARRENMLLNPETGGVMIIDFERSQLLSPPRRQLAALEPNKRRRIQDTRGKIKAVSRPGGVKSQPEPGFLHDIAGVRGAFMWLDITVSGRDWLALR
ncbi:Protein kinase-like domain protein, partial [Metarhizium majus ARSEF 297]